MSHDSILPFAGSVHSRQLPLKQLDPATDQPPVPLLYDAGCGFCRWSLAKVLACDRRGRLRPVALDSAEADALLGGMSEERRMASWHLVGPDGEVRSAGAAVAPLMRLLPGGAPIAWLAGRFPRLTERAYRCVAEHRAALGRLIGQRAAARARAGIDARKRP
jgi:predicted DCC family thiol-disulfide oxidoreductase YuxK